MTDETKKPSDDAGAGPVAGERLADARRAREISIHDVAKELHLDEPKVRALEQNQFDILGAPVFAKGYLRKYAELVGVSVDDVLADYNRFDRSSAVLPILGTRQKPSREISPGPWLVGILVVAIVAGAAWLWFSGALDLFFSDRGPATLAPFAVEEPSATDASGLSQQREQQPQQESEAGNSTQPGSQSAAEPTSSGPARDNEPGAGPEDLDTVAAADRVELTISFSGDCWTEVSDGTGERLYFGLGTAGDSVSIAGESPLHLLLGDSDNATVTAEGENVPIPQSARRGETARLTITSR